MVSRNHPRRKSLVFAGTARLPSAPTGGAYLVVELEVDGSTLAVESVHINPQFGGLKKVLESILVGEPMSTVAEAAYDAITVSYFSPYRNAARAALLNAAEAFTMFRKRQSEAGLLTRARQVE